MSYTTTQAIFKGETWHTCRSDMVCSVPEVAEAFYKDIAPARDVRGDMFVYLFRRFGYPIYGWDGYKTLIDYHLTTPDPRISVLVTPRSGYRMAFGYGLRADFHDEMSCLEQSFRRAKVGSFDQTDEYKHIVASLEATFADLLIPVHIRDVPVNIFGEVKEYERNVEYSPQAGYGIDVFDPVEGVLIEEPTP